MVTELHEQGSFGWFRERWGRITMSQRIDAVISGNPLQLNRLLDTLRWERATADDDALIRKEWERSVIASDVTEALRWGNTYEPEAIAEYELRLDVDLHRPGFKFHPIWPLLVGDSADFVEVDSDGAPIAVGEVKCYLDSTKHLNTLRFGMDPEHYNQVQGHMEHWDVQVCKFLTYDPRVVLRDRRLHIEVIHRDPAWSTLFRRRMEQVVTHLQRGTKFEFEMTAAVDGLPSIF